MTNLLNEIKKDLNFIKSHTLQPEWYKVLKVFILLGFLLSYFYFFGILKTIIFFAFFIFLSILLHLLYRVKTDTWKQSWLDFVVVEENNQMKAQSIGGFYYSAIAINAILSMVISQVLL